MIDNEDSAKDDDLDDVVGLTDEELASLSDDEPDTTVDAGEQTQDEGQGEAVEPIVAAEPSEPTQFVPEYKADGIENIDEIQKNLDSSYAELSDKLDNDYENGELSFVEYRKQSRELDARYFAEKERISSARLKAEIATEQSKQIAEQKWQWEQDTFFKDNPEFKTDPILFGALNSTLQAAYADEASKGKSGLQLIRESAEKVSARFNSKPIQNNQQRMSDKPAAKPVELPKILSNIPSAETNQETGGEFDYIDKLSGIEYERAIAKLSPEAHDRFLNS